jgi:hypothetical protein
VSGGANYFFPAEQIIVDCLALLHFFSPPESPLFVFLSLGLRAQSQVSTQACRIAASYTCDRFICASVFGGCCVRFRGSPEALNFQRPDTPAFFLVEAVCLAMSFGKSFAALMTVHIYGYFLRLLLLGPPNPHLRIRKRRTKQFITPHSKGFGQICGAPLIASKFVKINALNFAALYSTQGLS